MKYTTITLTEGYSMDTILDLKCCLSFKGFPERNFFQDFNQQILKKTVLFWEKRAVLYATTVMPDKARQGLVHRFSYNRGI